MCYDKVIQDDLCTYSHHLSCGHSLSESEGYTSRGIATHPPLVGLLVGPFQRIGLTVPFNSPGLGLRPLQGTGLNSPVPLQSMALSKPQLTYLDKVQGHASAMQKDHFICTIYTMGIRTIEETLKVEPNFFSQRLKASASLTQSK